VDDVRTLFTNGRIYSPWARDAGAMLIEDADVAWLGDIESASTLTAHRVVDLQGALVAPAFVDAHFHTTGTGLSLHGVNLAATPTLRAALDLIERTGRASGGRPIIGSGWDEQRWPEGRPMSAHELDRASYGSVVYLARVDAHSAVVSSALMAAVPELKSMAGYRPDGLLTAAAHHAARRIALDSITATQRADLQRAALRQAGSHGIAAVHEMAGPDISGAADLAALLDLAGIGAGTGPERSEPFPEVFGYWAELGGVRTAVELGAVGAGGDLFCDGSLGSRTAALTEPYADAAGCGELQHELAELVEHILQCADAGMQTGFHAIGDAAVAQVVAAMTEAAGRRPQGAITGAGHRIEHAELVPSIVSLAESGLLASVQPAFDATWGGESGMYADRLGPKRARALNPYAGLAAAGVPLAFGSDSPVTPVNPWAAVRAAVYPSNTAHALSPRAAFGAHTRGGWRAARADGDGSGMLSPGAPATFAVYAAGALGVDAPDGRLSQWSTDERSGVPGLPDLAPGQPLPRCLRTVTRGVTIFDAGELG
jgi:predicted amidohydrolase YtcJ